MKLGRTVIAAISITALSVSLAACSTAGGSDNKQKVTFWQFDTA